MAKADYILYLETFAVVTVSINARHLQCVRKLYEDHIFVFSRMRLELVQPAIAARAQSPYY